MGLGSTQSRLSAALLTLLFLLFAAILFLFLAKGAGYLGAGSDTSGLSVAFDSWAAAVASIAALAILAGLYSLTGLKDHEHALALPKGSVRAFLALDGPWENKNDRNN